MKKLFLFLILISLGLFAQKGPDYVSEPSVPTVSPPVKDLPPSEQERNPYALEMKRREEWGYSGESKQGFPWDNPLLEYQKNAPQPDFLEQKAFSTPIINVNGYTSPSSPPDTTGDVGPNHFLQATNAGGYGSLVHIYTKTGTFVQTFAMESLASSAPCNNGYCDPIVLYDKFADRWVVSEFPYSGSYFCVYVSTSPNPQGTWYVYTFGDLGYGGPPDYPKYGIWPLDEDGDGQYLEGSYLIGVNAGATGKRDLYALDRKKMLQGQPATYQKFSVSTLSAFGFQLVLPAGHEGPEPPPQGKGALFLRPVDTEIHSGFTCSEPCDLMQIWELKVDWTTPANSTLTELPRITIAEFDHTLCGTSGNWNCMPQPNTTQKIDPIREPLHFPVQYRNFGSYETIVGCFAEDASGTDRAGVHWFELRRQGSSWTKYQEGVLSADTLHRSVCSAAMDGWGNIAVGYTRTGSVTPYYPSIYYAGRLSSDPLNTMPYFEYSIQDATSSNTDNERWGDYAGIGVDPNDDCTFWFTTEYGGSGQTKIAAFKFDSCGCIYPGAPQNLTASPNGNNSIYLQWSQGSPEGTTFNIYRKIGSCPQSNYVKIASNISGLSYVDNTVSGGITYAYVVKAVDITGKCESPASSCDDAQTTGVCLEPPSFGGIQSVSNAENSTCTLNLSWNAGTSICGGTLAYNIYRSTSNPFTPSSSNLIATGISGTSFSDTVGLVYNTNYYYIVRAVDLSNGVEDNNSVIMGAVPTGPVTIQNFADNFEGSGGFDNPGWTHQPLTGSVDWQWSTAQSQSPTHSWFSPSQTTIADRVLVTPQIGVLLNTTMSFYHTYNFEGTSTCYDGGTLEYSTNGTTWTVVPDSFFTSGGFNGTVSTSYGNPIGGKRAWCFGTIGPMTQVNLNLGSLAGNTIYLRFHAGEDSSQAGTGWYVDTVRINNAGTQSSCETGAGCTPPSPPALNSATATCSGINLNYSAGTGDTQSFNVYRISGSCGGTAQKIAGPVISNTYLDTTANDGGTYSYLIKGSCSPSGTPESNFSNCISAVSYSVPNPTISGSTSNTCPAETVTLTTQSGMNNYQWYKNGNPIDGANSNTLIVSETGSYSVSYKNSSGCTGTSLPFSVTINQCLPNIVYLNSTAPVPVEEDGDGIPEAGEKWKMDVTLKNTGSKDASDVLASLSGEGIISCSNPLNFGNISVNGEKTGTFEFVIDPSLWYSTYTCGSSIGFDITNKTSNSGAYNYTNDLNFRTTQVGIPGTNLNQNSTAPGIFGVKNTSSTSAFSPTFTLTPDITSGSVSFTLSGTTNYTNCVRVELLAPDNSFLLLKDYGQAIQSSYDIKDFYNLKGTGTYSLRAYEQQGCGTGNQYVNVENISMSIQKQIPANCSTSSYFCGLSEVQNLKLFKDGTSVKVQFSNLGNFKYNLYVSKYPNTHPFNVTGSTNGKKDCNVQTLLNGTLREISSYSLESGITGEYSCLYILVTADNGFGTEGGLGFDSFSQTRTASEYCAR
ncbi:MAG: hypothetical protein WHV67_05295 [Thermoanaerobaculia bacterium]